MDIETTQAEITNVDTVAVETVTMTVAELNARMAASRRSGEQSATRKADPAPQPVHAAQANVQPRDSIAEMQVRLDAMEQRNAFDRALIGRSISAENVALLHELYTAQKPTDLHGWIDPTIARFGFAKPVVQQPGQPAAAPSNVVPVQFDVMRASGFISSGQLSPEQIANPVVLRQVHEHNKNLSQRAAGAPPRREIPGRK